MNNKEKLMIHECNGEYCLAFDIVDPYHDIEMASILGVSYEAYLKILHKYNGVSVKNNIKYSEADTLNSTDTWFKSLEDCKKALKELNNYMEENKIMTNNEILLQLTDKEMNDYLLKNDVNYSINKFDYIADYATDAWFFWNEGLRVWEK